ncbi:MAG: diguanylate cyclase [Stagnimonas sp.]|nr:diguanylate cyclase [Stagnimonas sp.]
MFDTSGNALRLLIVDDNPDDRFSYRRMLGKADDQRFEIFEADSAEAGLAALATHNPQFLLLDFHLPDGNGIEVLRQLRMQHPRLPVVMLTGLDDVNTSVAALHAGADDYQIKGKLDTDSLLRSIRGALQKRALETQLVTERERMELFYRLVEASDDMLLVIQMPEGRVIEANQSAVRQLGRSRESLLDPTLDLLSVFPNAVTVWATLSPAAPARRLDCEAIRADGTRLPIEVSANRVVLGEKLYFVAVCRDATERHEMEAQLRRLVLLDALTGVNNRRAFDERFEQEFLRAARGHGALGLLMVDVDHFKLYNDTYGHQAGDKCLRQVAQALTATLKRPSDFVARYGGEEFAVLLPDADMAGALAAAELLLQRVRELALPHSTSSVGDFVSISIGVAVAKPPVRGELENFMAKADQRLYKAKHAGRNRAVSEE